MLKTLRDWLYRQIGALALPPTMTQVALSTGLAGFHVGAVGPAVKLYRANGGRKPVRVELLLIDDLSLSPHDRAQVIQDVTKTAFETLEKAAIEVRVPGIA